MKVVTCQLIFDGLHRVVQAGDVSSSGLCQIRLAAALAAAYFRSTLTRSPQRTPRRTAALPAPATKTTLSPATEARKGRPDFPLALDVGCHILHRFRVHAIHPFDEHDPDRADRAQLVDQLRAFGAIWIVLIERMDGMDAKAMKDVASNGEGPKENAAAFLASVAGDKVVFVAGAGRAAVRRGVRCGDLVKVLRKYAAARAAASLIWHRPEEETSPA